MSKDTKLIDAQETLEKYLKNVDPSDLALDDFLVDNSILLRSFRLSNKLTQSEVAKLCNIKQSMVSKFEGGEYNPSIASLWRYVNRLGGVLKISISSAEQQLEEKPSLTINEYWKTPESTDFTFLEGDESKRIWSCVSCADWRNE